MTTQTLEKITETPKKTTSFVALIYYPGVETQESGNNYNLTGIRSFKRMPSMRYFQFDDPVSGVLKSIIVHPGTNIGYHVRNPGDDTERILKLPTEWFEAIFNQPLNKLLLDKKGIIPVYPKPTTTLEGVPQYSEFSEEDALMLVANHMHEKWINSALVTEQRATVKTLAEERKKQVIENRRKLQEGI